MPHRLVVVARAALVPSLVVLVGCSHSAPSDPAPPPVGDMAAAGTGGNGIPGGSGDLAGGGDLATADGGCDGPCAPIQLTKRAGQQGTAVAFGASYIVVGYGGVLLTSADGITWTAGSFGLLWDHFEDVAASTSASCRYLAVASAFYPWSGGVACSSDGKSWTAASGAAAPAYAVVWGKGQYVVAGGKGEFDTSPDGVTWTRHVATGGSFAKSYPRRIIWTGTQYVVVGYTDYDVPLVATSSDGAGWIWQTTPSGTTAAINGVAFGRGILVAVGSAGNDLSGTRPAVILTSSDGVNWTAPTAPADRSFTAVAWTGSWFIAFADDGSTIVSSEGVTWLAGPTAAGVSDVVAAGPRGLVAVGRGGILTAEK